jgi:hypothetical protein
MGPPRRRGRPGDHRAADEDHGVGRSRYSTSRPRDGQDVAGGEPVPQVEFLKRRFARALERGDDAHAEIIRQLLDRLLKGLAR